MIEIKNSRFVGFEELKRSVSMEQVLRRYGLMETLRRSGESLTGVCPLHHGHNPTQFRVSLGRNCWICFGDCHSGGSIVDFVARMEGTGIRDAGMLLQDWFGVNPDSVSGAKPSQSILPDKRGREAEPPPGLFNPPLRFALGPLEGIHPYLWGRGLSVETIATFGVGCCAHGTLRGWIAIPIHDIAGRLVAYAGRWPGGPVDGMPKYRLPRGFRKSLELFNQHRAKAESRAEPLVVVEGFFGCMRVWQAGHRRVVSLMGSTLSKAQEQRIIEIAGATSRVLLLFDEDAAGRKGRMEALTRLRESVSVEIVRLQEGQQPDSLPPEELLRLIGRARETEVAA